MLLYQNNNFTRHKRHVLHLGDKPSELRIKKNFPEFIYYNRIILALHPLFAKKIRIFTDFS